MFPIAAVFATVACAREAPEVIKEVPSPSSCDGGAAAFESADWGDSTGSVAGRSGRGGEDDPRGAGARSGEVRDGATGAQGARPRLTASHPGFSQALCFECNGTVTPYPHRGSGFRPSVCASCHGYNGAPHGDHAVAENSGCPNCHGTVVHVPKFVAPADCIGCRHQGSRGAS